MSGKDTALSIAKKLIDVVLIYNSDKTAADEIVKEQFRPLDKKLQHIVNIDGFVSELQALLQSEFTAEKIDFLINNGGFGASNLLIAETTEK